MDVTKNQFDAFMRVQMEGRFNMLMPEAQSLTGLSNETYCAILDNYGALKDKYGSENKEEDEEKEVLKTFRVWGDFSGCVSVEVEALDAEDAKGMAAEVFGGITGYCGNGGTDKLIGVAGLDECIAHGDDIDWNEVETL